MTMIKFESQEEAELWKLLMISILSDACVVSVSQAAVFCDKAAKDLCEALRARMPEGGFDHIPDAEKMVKDHFVGLNKMVPDADEDIAYRALVAAKVPGFSSSNVAAVMNLIGAKKPGGAP